MTPLSDHVDKAGKVTLRYRSKLLHIGIAERTQAIGFFYWSPTVT
jgi:hypothetical protein